MHNHSRTRPRGWLHGQGYSLIESLAVLTIAGILTGAIWPSFDAMIQRSRATATINWLVAALHFTRHSAVVYRSTVTICAPRDPLTCGGDWHDGLMVFTDHNRDARVNGDDEVLRRTAPPHEHGTVRYRAFQNRRYLQYTQLGYTHYQNGNFVYCPESGDINYARQLVVNVQGRVRVIHYRDDEGVPIDRLGKPLRC